MIWRKNFFSESKLFIFPHCARILKITAHLVALPIIKNQFHEFFIISVLHSKWGFYRFYATYINWNAIFSLSSNCCTFWFASLSRLRLRTHYNISELQIPISNLSKNWQISWAEDYGKSGLTVVLRSVDLKSTGRSVVKNRPRPTDFDRPRTLVFSTYLWISYFFSKITQGPLQTFNLDYHKLAHIWSKQIWFGFSLWHKVCKYGTYHVKTWLVFCWKPWLNRKAA